MAGHFVAAGLKSSCLNALEMTGLLNHAEVVGATRGVDRLKARGLIGVLFSAGSATVCSRDPVNGQRSASCPRFPACGG